MRQILFHSTVIINQLKMNKHKHLRVSDHRKRTASHHHAGDYVPTAMTNRTVWWRVSEERVSRYWPFTSTRAPAPGSVHQISCLSPSDGHHHVVLGTALTAASRSYCIDIHRKLCFCFCLKNPYYTTFGKSASWARCDRIWMPLSHEEGKRPMKRGTAPVTCCNLGWEVHLSTDAVSLLRASPFILGPCFLYNPHLN